MYCIVFDVLVSPIVSPQSCLKIQAFEVEIQGLKSKPELKLGQVTDTPTKMA